MSTHEDFLNHPIEALEKALHLRKQIESLKSNLASFFGGVTDVSTRMYAAATGKSKRKGKRTMSAAARARIAAAQRARWAK